MLNFLSNLRALEFCRKMSCSSCHNVFYRNFQRVKAENISLGEKANVAVLAAAPGRTARQDSPCSPGPPGGPAKLPAGRLRGLVRAAGKERQAKAPGVSIRRPDFTNEQGSIMSHFLSTNLKCN